MAAVVDIQIAMDAGPGAHQNPDSEANLGPARFPTPHVPTMEAARER
jgi:hypothetical protein